jgi:outer membrane lipoprotein carrier protein
MRKILIGVATAGVMASIALGAREHLLREAPPSVPPSAVELDGTAAPVTDGEALPDAAPAGVAETVPLPTAGDAESPPAARRPAAAAEVPASGAERPFPVTPPSPAAGQDAGEVLRRAAAAYGRVETLRADFVQRIENPLLRTRTTSRGVLYQRRPDRFLMRFADPDGDMIVSDGAYFWVYYPSVDARQVIRAPAGEGRAGAVDLQAQFLGDPLRRFAATVEGVEDVGGRRATVLTLVPREAAPYRSLKVWVDVTDNLVRRFEIREESGAVRHFELSNVQVNGRLADDLFRFTPPAGAQVIDRS